MIEFSITVYIFGATKIVRFMKKAIALIFIALCMQVVFAQDDKKSEKIYDPTRNAAADVADAVKKAQSSGKNVLIQVGGNWCPWCIRVHKFMAEEPEVAKALADGYVFLLVNYSKENKNEEVLRMLKNPSRFGFPVFVVLDGAGNVIHIQDSGYLEEGKTYSKEKLLRFLKLWTVDAISGKK